MPLSVVSLFPAYMGASSGFYPEKLLRFWTIIKAFQEKMIEKTLTFISKIGPASFTSEDLSYGKMTHSINRDNK